MKQLTESIAYFRDDFIPFSDANVSIASGPVLYGLSVYTVIPVFMSESKQLSLFRVSDHFKRLQNSAKIVAFEDFNKNWNEERFLHMLTELITKNSVDCDSLLRISIFVDDILKGTRMHDLPHSVSAFIYPITDMLPKSGASLQVSSWRRNADNALPSRAKINGSYVNAALMKHEAVMNGYDDAVALDEQGHVTESTVSNIFLVKNNQLITPGTSHDLLEGITRDSIMKLAKNEKIDCIDRTIDRSELYTADELFLCGSSMNIVPVISVDKRQIGSGSRGKVTKKIQDNFKHYTHAPHEPFMSWLTPVVN